MYAEADYLPLSALQHWVFCPRQCGLIHLEQVWDENRLTAEGRILHQRVHEMSDEFRSDISIVRGLRIYSRRLGLIGQADVVEFHRAPTGIALPDAEGIWQPYPVEYKRGSPKMDACDEVQLCAQAICLEEMLGIAVPQGAFFTVARDGGRKWFLRMSCAERRKNRRTSCMRCFDRDARRVLIMRKNAGPVLCTIYVSPKRPAGERTLSTIFKWPMSCPGRR
ncbi:MAG TPA: CRISPR-associated protein Cas4 [Anaerohalosphaeraceae bacterium]|nr:CRISPR-associated protein Cas4 [Anaerohalosphaeraceae bacterium]HOL89931.1 CRISPR-associated protein Cas4 [Anaerohalosphaeraceae bacterium]HPP57424.1 CRISPR-associated protein Cas4 [Anaerohalosphaeraceae bacterium]